MAAIDGVAFQQPQLRHLHMSVMEPNLPRPESALARGIKITEFSGSRVNPEPVTFEESDILLEEYLSPRRLRELTGVDDLDKVHFLELKVNTSDTSLGNFGVNIPQLLQLKLSNSIIPSFRDLGSSLNNVRVLWMAQCGLRDLESVSSMSGLRELYLAYNELTDISPCSMLDELRILDVEGNNITEISQVEFLALCQNLTHLTLEGNPVCLTPYPDQAVPDYDYRKAVRTALPQLKYLDDESMETVVHARPDTSKPAMSGFEEDWKLLQELMEEGIVISADNDTDSTGRPGTACRPNSALRPYTSTGLRPWSSIKTASPTGRPRTGIRPGSRAGTARPGSAAALGTADMQSDVDEASALTTGGVVCGNPSKALRARQQQMRSTSAPSHITTSKSMLQLKKKAPTKTYDATKEEETVEDEHLVELFEELKQWKAGHEKRVKEIEASKAPQVLTIDHDEVEEAEDEEATSSSNEEEDEDSECSSNAAGDGYEAFFRPTSLATAAESETYEGARPKIHPPGVPAPKHRRPVSMALQENTSSPLPRFHHDESFESYDPASSPDSTPDGARVESFEPAAWEREEKILGRSRGFGGEAGRAPTTLPSGRLNTALRPVVVPGLPSRAAFNLAPVADRKAPTTDMGRASPVIRSPGHSPEKRVTEPVRHGPSSPAVGRVPQLRPLERVRQRDLANVPLLPSKYKSDS